MTTLKGARGDPNLVARLLLPPASSRTAEVLTGAALLGLFTALAMYHLATRAQTPTYGVVAAMLWLVLVAFVFVAGLSSLGLRMMLAVCLGACSRRHFVEAQLTGNRTAIRFGFELFTRQVYSFRLEVGQIISIKMSPGQATERAGRDMDDWSVVLWYHSQCRWFRSRQPRYHADEEVRIIGVSGPKQEIAQFLAAFIAFLRAAGVELCPGEGENEFLAKPAD